MVNNGAEKMYTYPTVSCGKREEKVLWRERESEQNETEKDRGDLLSFPAQQILGCSAGGSLPKESGSSHRPGGRSSRPGIACVSAPVCSPKHHETSHNGLNSSPAFHFSFCVFFLHSGRDAAGGGGGTAVLRRVV